VDIAFKRAQKSCGISFSQKGVVIIGDSPNDIACGKSYGVKTIATATGNHRMEELRKHKPDYLFKDLSDYQEIVRAIAA
jgi:phosphoglycolate phosphatase-like HAD superfamily hydrolase